MIPRILFQTWEEKEIPDHWKEGPESFKRLHPDWKYTLLDHQDRIAFIHLHFPELDSIFQSYPYLIQQADLIRYAVLYVHGGVYSDVKNIFRYRLDDFFALEPSRDLYLSRSANTGGVSNYFLASRPGHPLWLTCLQDALERNGQVPFYVMGRHCTVFYSTGPWLLDRSISKLKLKKDKFLLPVGFQPCNLCQHAPHCKIDETKYKTYIVPLKGRSWNGWDSKTINWIYCNQKFLKVLSIVCFVVWYYNRRK